MKIKINRAFSVPANTKVTMKYYHLNTKYEKKFIAENSFKNFFFDVLKNIKNNKLNIYHSAILEDARFKDQILKNNL